MSEHCREKWEFENVVKNIIKKIVEVQVSMEEQKKLLLQLRTSLKNVALKGECSGCQHRMECVTSQTQLKE